MPDFLSATFGTGPPVNAVDVLIRLVTALLLGCLVAWIYIRTRGSTEIGASFPTTLALLAVLIAMVTQVIGDNVARAFSLVGALSIVRFRTVVRDTKDTAYVIFAVVVGMAVGAQNLPVALIGIGVIGAAAFAMSRTNGFGHGIIDNGYLLSVKVGLGHDHDRLLAAPLDQHLERRQLMAVSTARQGTLLELTYEAYLRKSTSPEEFVKTLNGVEGVQDVRLQRHGFEQV